MVQYQNYPLKWVSQIPLSIMPTVWTGEGETLLGEKKKVGVLKLFKTLYP